MFNAAANSPIASRLVQADVPLYKVMHLMGRKSMHMVLRYAHLAPDYRRDAINAMEALEHKKGTVRQDAAIAA